MIDQVVIGRTIDAITIGITVDYVSVSSTTLPLSETDFRNLGLSSEDVDARLNYLYSIGTQDVIIYIGGNDPRTSASDVAVTGLTMDGCQIDSST